MTDRASRRDAMLVLRQLMIAAEPVRVGDVEAYTEHVFTLGREHDWHAVAIYDHRYRSVHQGLTASWSATGDSGLWTEVLQQQFASMMAPARASSTAPRSPIRAAAARGKARPAGGAPDRASSTAVKDEACRQWNSGACRHRACRYQHKCSGCGGAHAATACTTTPKESAK